MTTKPIDHQMSALNTVHEAKHRQDQQNRGQLINAVMQDKMKEEVMRNKAKVLQGDQAQGGLVDPDQKKKNPHPSRKRQQKQQIKRSENSSKEFHKGTRLDIRI